ncbi:hypothetical protein ACFL2Q_17555 [Thermodesulfobacteriota bacterium]
MNVRTCFKSVSLVILLFALVAVPDAFGQTLDIRGQWVGKAKGRIFGAEGSVTITQQEGENISGIVQGGNVFGKAKFRIKGTIRGNRIIGEKQGNIFQGFIYSDGSIRGTMKTTDGEVYHVFLRRPFNPWGGYPNYGFQ